MSQRWGSFEDFDFSSVLRELEKWYHVPTMLVLFAFMLWTRAQTWSNFVRDGEVLFSGNDAWYHLRQTTYTVQNWPRTMPFDPWTNFPAGTASSQFGTLWDQLMATAALVVGLGDPSGKTIAMVVLFAPAVAGALAAIPVYYAGRRVGGRFGGLVGVLVLALSSGGFLRRSFVGFSDHHVAEAFMQVTAVLAVMVAVSVAETEKPVWELVVGREWDALRRTAGWATIAGVAIAAYIWVWPPAVLLVGILGVYFVLQLNIDYLRGRSPEHLAFAGAVALGIAGLLAFVPFNSPDLDALDFSILQPLLAFGVAFGCVFMAWLARTWDDRDYDPRLYPVTVFGIIAVLTGLLAVVLPSTFDYLLSQLLRVVGGVTGAGAGTVGEAQGLPRPFLNLFTRYGLTFISAGIAGLFMLVSVLRSDDYDSEKLLIVVWGLFMFSATLTQSRFDYYFVMPIVIANAFLVGWLFRYLAPGGATEIETFQVLTVITVVLVIVTPMVVSVGRGPTTAMAQSQVNAPSDGVVGWEDGLDWMSQNTPQPGTYGGAGNGMEYYGTYANREDFDYAQGSYGVISWWDYGHWITTRGERIAVANPFQQNARNAANFLLAPNETYADDALGVVSEDDARTQYVMVDWKMVNTWSQLGGKQFAPHVFTDLEGSRRDHYQRVFSVGRGGSVRTAYYVRTQRFYESMVNRLWYFHGSAAEPRPVVVDYRERRVSQGQTAYLTPSQGNPRLRIFRNMSAARAFVEADGSAQVGGVGPNPERRIPALEHYRLVHQSNVSALQRGSAYTSSIQQEARGLNVTSFAQLTQVLLPQGRTPWTKTFERVPGATIRGTGPENTNLTASVQMRALTTNSTFVYRQQVRTGPDGEFTMTVPYSTEGYEAVGPSNGYTNVSVRATGPYRIRSPVQQNESGYLISYAGTVSVTERQVVGADDSAAEVTLEERVLGRPSTGGSDGSGDSGSGDDSGDSGSSGDSGDGSNVEPPRRPVLADPADTAGPATGAVLGPANEGYVTP